MYENVYNFVKALNKWKCNKKTIKQCFIDCIEYLIEKELLEKDELEFYKIWLDDLDSIGYKWPKINRNPTFQLKSTIMKIFHKSNEQEHSSNSNENEQSELKSKSNIKKFKFIESFCQIEIDKSIERCQLNKFVMITFAKTIEDIIFIQRFINIHVTYIIICIENNQSKIITESFINDILIRSTGLTFIIMENEDNFKKCIINSMNIGFKQQSFLILKHFKLLNYLIAEKNIEFSHLTESTMIDFNDLSKNEEENLNKFSYFIRKNVANGIRLVNVVFSNKSQTVCDYYREKKDEELCSNWLNSIDKLNWHQNDLASEYCENIKRKTLFIPDFHDGPRVDLTSTMIFLGISYLLIRLKFIFYDCNLKRSKCYSWWNKRFSFTIPRSPKIRKHNPKIISICEAFHNI